MVVRQGHPAVVVAPPPQLVAHRRIKQGDCSKGKGRGKGKGKSRDKIDESLAAHAFNAGAAAAYEQRQRQNRDHPNASCAIISCSIPPDFSVYIQLHVTMSRGNAQYACDYLQVLVLEYDNIQKA